MSAPRFTPSDKIVGMMSQTDRKALHLETREEIDTKLEAKDEAQIQREVESWLKLNGFNPRSPAFLDGKTPQKGWFIHINQAKKNPILLDLLIFTLDGRCLELELKTRTGKIRPEQKAILDTTLCTNIARSTVEAITIIKEWLK